MKLLCFFLASALFADTNYVKKTICASGCDYSLSPSQLQTAMSDAATYQDTLGQCIPYIIEVNGAITGITNKDIPGKACGQFVEFRSVNSNKFTPGQRYNPATDDTNAATFSGASTSAMFRTGTAYTRYWRFRNIKFTTETGAGYSSFIGWGEGFGADFHAMPDHLEVIQCGLIARGVEDAATGIASNGNHVRLIDSYLSNFSKNPLQDSQAFTWTYGTYAELRNNYFSAVTETLGMGGGTVVPSGMLPSFLYVAGNNITKEPWMNHVYGSGAPTKPCFEGNWYHDDTGNQDYLCSAVSGVWNLQGSLLPYTLAPVKNVFENKMALGMRVYGNSLGPMPARSDQNPMFFQFNLVTQVSSPSCHADNPTTFPQPCDTPQQWTAISDVSITANDLHDGMSVMSMGGSSGGGGLPCSVDPTPPCFSHGIRLINFSHNLVRNISDPRNYCVNLAGDGKCWAESGVGGGSYGMLNFGGGQEEIVLAHNTLAPSTLSSTAGYNVRAGLMGSIGFQPGQNSGQFTILGNIFQAGVYGVQFGSGVANGCALQETVTSGTGAMNLHTNLISMENPTPQIWYGVPLAAVVPGCMNDKWPLDHASISSVASILDGSYKVTSGSGYQNWSIDGRDPGADIDLVAWRTAHAIDGAPAPALDYHIRSLIPTTGHGLKIYFTAPDTASCSWELSTNEGAYSSPVAVSSQTRTGRDGIAMWNDGTLSASQAYWARATCSSKKLETRLNGERAYVITAP